VGCRPAAAGFFVFLFVPNGNSSARRQSQRHPSSRAPQRDPPRRPRLIEHTIWSRISTPWLERPGRSPRLPTLVVGKSREVSVGKRGALMGPYGPSFPRPRTMFRRPPDLRWTRKSLPRAQAPPRPFRFEPKTTPSFGTCIVQHGKPPGQSAVLWPPHQVSETFSCAARADK